jgi:hypothetical protein
LDFGEASRTSKELRDAWGDVLAHVADNRMAGRLTGRLVKVLQGDTRHAAGRRKAVDGDLLLLKGFEFNKHADFSRVFSPTYRISVSQKDKEVSVYVPAWSTQDGISPHGATHVRLVAVVTSIDFHNGSINANMCRSTFLDIQKTVQPSLELVNAIPGNPGDGVIVALGIECYQELNGEMKTLVNGSAMVIAEAVHSRLRRNKTSPPTSARSQLRRAMQSKDTNGYEMFPVEHQVDVEVNDREESQKLKTAADEILKQFCAGVVNAGGEVTDTFAYIHGP